MAHMAHMAYMAYGMCQGSLRIGYIGVPRGYSKLFKAIQKATTNYCAHKVYCSQGRWLAGSPGCPQRLEKAAQKLNKTYKKLCCA